MSGVDHSTLDSLCRSLADSRRRIILSCLLDAEAGSATVDELVDRVIEAEDHSSSPDLKSVRVALVHTHLPLRAENGLIDHERDRGIVTTTSDTGQIKPHLTAVQTMDCVSTAGD